MDDIMFENKISDLDVTLGEPEPDEYYQDYMRERQLAEAEFMDGELMQDKRLFEIMGNARSGMWNLSSEKLRRVVRSSGYRSLPKEIKSLLGLLEAYEAILQESKRNNPDPVMLTNVLFGIQAACQDAAMISRNDDMDNLIQGIVSDSGRLLSGVYDMKQDSAYIPTAEAKNLKGGHADKQTQLEFNKANMVEDESSQTYEVSDDGFSQYKIMSYATAATMARQNEYNPTTKSETSKKGHIYASQKDGQAIGYVNTPNASSINAYLRGETPEQIEGNIQRFNPGFRLKDNWESGIKETIQSMDKAAEQNQLDDNYKFYRMLRAEYVSSALGLGDYIVNGTEIRPDVVLAIQKKAGTVIEDKSYMSVGFNADVQFAGSPIMLTLLCDKGTRVFATENLPESELILGRNTSYMIVGARWYGNKKKNVPVSARNGMQKYSGLEIFAKVLGNGEEPEKLERYDSVRDELEASGKVIGKENSLGFQQFLGTLDNVEHALDASVAADNYDTEYAKIGKAYQQIFAKGQDYLNTHKWTFSLQGRRRKEKVWEAIMLCTRDYRILQDRGMDILAGNVRKTWRMLLHTYNGKAISDSKVTKEAVQATLEELSDVIAGDDRIMSAEQFEAYIKRANGTDDIPSDIDELLMFMKAYERNTAAHQADAARNNVLGIKSVQLLGEKCKEVRKHYNSHGNVYKAIVTLEQQTARRIRQLAAIDDTQVIMGQIDGSTSQDTHARHVTAAGEFSEYGYLTNQEAKGMAEKNKYNQGDYIRQLYGKYKGEWFDGEGRDYGYIRTDKSFKINQHLRENRKLNKPQTEEERRLQTTIHNLQNASQINEIPRKIRVHRMLNVPYLEYQLGISGELLNDLDGNQQEIMRQINKKSGTIVREDGFMCVGYNVDFMFSQAQLMLTLLCDAGTKCMATLNYGESELIFGRGTKYMIIGAIAHGNEHMNVPISNIENMDDNDVLQNPESGVYQGLEIIVKVIP